MSAAELRHPDVLSFVTSCCAKPRPARFCADFRRWHELRCAKTVLAKITLAVLALLLAIAAAAARADSGDGVERYDANRDGYISFDEWRNMGGEPSAFRASDADGDGRLRGEELERAEARDARLKAAETAGDAWVSAKVTAALLMDRALTIADMRVTTRKGRVRLAGVVHSEDDARAAERIAWRVEGVHAVINSLSVRPRLSAQ